MDAETYQNLNEGEKYQRIVTSEAYGELKTILTNKIMDLQSILNVEDKDVNSVVIDLKAKKIAIETLLETLRDIEGRADQHSSNKTLVEGDFVIHV